MSNLIGAVALILFVWDWFNSGRDIATLIIWLIAVILFWLLLCYVVDHVKWRQAGSDKR